MKKYEVICGIYKITSPTGRVYIGKSVNVYERFNLYKLLHCKSQPILYRSIEKYGWGNHKAEIIEVCSSEVLIEREIYWIAHYNSHANGMNCTLGGEGTMGRVWTEEDRRKHSIRLKGVMAGERNPFFGKKHSEESKKMVGDKNRARILPEEEKRQKTEFLLEYQKNNPHPSLGRKQSDEHIRDRVKKNTGKKRTEETKKRQSEKAMGNQRWFGRKHKQSSKEKIRIANTGRIISEEWRKNMSLAKKGVKQPKEAIEKRLEKVRKIILNTQTGVFYFGIKEAAHSINSLVGTLSPKLGGHKRNNTSLIYV